MQMERTSHQSENLPVSLRRILVVAAHYGVRRGISALLQQQAHLAVVAEARTGEEALQLAAAHRPDTVVMDVAIQGMACADTCQRILHQLPGTRIILVTSYLEDERLSAALRAGAVGSMLRRIGGNDLVAML